mgnify:CR=1 FL=1
MWDLTTPGLHKTHDSISHIVRILSFQKALDDGQIIPRWAPYLFEGIGSPVLILNYLLPYFFSSAIHGIGFSFIDSYKITLALSFKISGITAYFYFKCIWLRSWVGQNIIPSIIDCFQNGDWLTQ